MNGITIKSFTATTAEDQSNYFSGEVQDRLGVIYGNSPGLPAGRYRVIDGKLDYIITGLSPQKIKESFDSLK